MRNYIIDNGVLIEYKGNAAQPSIPKNVTEIGAWAFYCCDTITSIKIPDSVTKINNSAFRHCTNLQSVEIPNSVTEIGWGAFTDCKNLTSINIPSSVRRIGYRAFAVCSSLRNIEIPKSVAIIGEHAFCGCYNLASIQIPSSVKYIGDCAFDVKEVKPQYNSNGSLRAFKAFFHDWTCRGFQYEVGKTYHQDGKTRVCQHGFHACPNPLNVFKYYAGEIKELRFAEVELSGEMDKYFDKIAASDIKIVRELTISELAEIYNTMEKC